ncbi:hypothetical protein J437_LFUL016381 [Ladona fulva]|uniref:Uncharacterized protein n=1 Tax=Ladona fulva TaxID=123851 RepID=A0A8K0KL63_LADFU|nr:hypothetical protein J437_LFUL016381 [Ladona fulva]
MDYPRPQSVALADVASITQRRVLPQLNPLEEYCLECGRSDDKEFENMLHHSLTDASAFAESSRRAAARRNNPMSYKHLMSRPTLPNEVFPWSYADWQVAGDPGNGQLMQEWVYAKWPEWEPTESPAVPTQFLPPPQRCSKCDVGTSKLRRLPENILFANVHHQGIISPESAPELSSTYEKHYNQPSAVQSSMFYKRYPKKSLKDGNREIRDVFSQNRRVRKGTKSLSIPIDDSTTDTEAAVDGRAAPQMKEKPHSVALRLIPEAMGEVKRRIAERSERARPSESSGTNRRQAEAQQQMVQGNEEARRNGREAAKGGFEGVASIAEEFEKKNWVSQAQLNTLYKSHKYGKTMRKASAPASVGGNAKGLGVIAESASEERPKSSASEKRTLNVACKSKSEEKSTIEAPKPPAPSPPSPLTLDNERYQLKLPLGPVSVTDIPEDDADDKSDHQSTGQAFHDMIDSMLAKKGLTSVTDSSIREMEPCVSPKSDSHKENQNDLKVADADEAKISGTETRVVTPNKGSPLNSPKTTLAEIVSKVGEDNVEKCIEILSKMSLKDKDNENSPEKDVATEPKIPVDVDRLKLEILRELTEQIVRSHSTSNSLNEKNDVFSTEDTTAVSAKLSQGESSTAQSLMEESGSTSRGTSFLY